MPAKHHSQLLIGLNCLPELHRAAIPRLAARIESWACLDQSSPVLAAEIGVRTSTLALVVSSQQRLLELADAELARAEHLGVHLVTRGEEGYPASLLELHDPPAVISWRGEVLSDEEVGIAVVGSRRADLYGLEAARFFGRHLAAGGATVVSGLALGVDAAAHRGALDTAGGRTVAVLGCGLARCYPERNRALATSIVERGGTVLSELPLAAPPAAHHFPVRNRLIAALSRAVVVVQAAPRSGSLVTARLALEIGREVLAVPGAIFDELALGPNALLRDGASPALHPADVLATVGLGEPPSPHTQPLTGAPIEGDGGALLTLLPTSPAQSPDTLARATGWSLEQVLTTLLELELAGLAARCAGGRFVRAAAGSGGRLSG